MLNDRFVSKGGGTRRERTHLATQATAGTTWVVVDAHGKTLGRVASQVAAILRGKHKPTYTPHVDAGDHVIVLNADRIVITGKKAEQKLYRHHSGYLGGLKTRTLGQLMERNPADVLQRAINGMLPHTRLGDVLRTRVRVYTGDQHPHEAQSPQVLQLK